MTTTAQPLTVPPTVADDLFEARRILAAHTDRGHCSDAIDAMHTEARNTYGDGFDPETVAYLALEGGNSDEHGNGEYFATGYDADGHEIEDCNFTVPGPAFSTGDVPETFRPDRTQPGPGHGHHSNGRMVIDVAKVDAHDFEADARNTQEAVVFSQVQRMWTRGDVESYIVTRDHLADVVREEAQGYQAILSPEEVTAAVDAVLADSRLEDAFAALRDEVYRLAAEQIETLTKGHPNA